MRTPANPRPLAASPRQPHWTLRSSWDSWLANDMQRVGPNWMQWVWTLLFSAVLAVGFTLLGYVLFVSREEDSGTLQSWAYWYGKNFVVCFTIGALIHLMFEVGAWLLGGPAALRKLKPWQRSLFFAGTPLLGVAIGWPIGMALSGSADMLPRLLGSTKAIAMVTTFSLGTSLLLHFYFGAKAKQLAAEKRAAEAQLRLLQGQIEPHFLFNTLAGVISLIDTDAPRAKHTLMAFTEYLRSSLGTLRRDDSTLGQELDLARHFLELLQARLEDRLQFDIDADPELLGLPLPPLLLQPLIENAVMHGIEPSLDGGRVTVSVRRSADGVELQVRDTGVGLDAAARRPARHGSRGQGNGIALANIRERLLARYNGQAELRIDAAEPGTRATITLPFEDGAPAH
jgi:signal transduction histidine kinase